MNTNHGLTPTVITDKNGRVTTVHKKGVSLPSSVKIPLFPVEASLLELRDNAYRSLSENFNRRGITLTKFQHQALNIAVRKLEKKHLRQLPLLLQPANDLADGVADDLIVNSDPDWIWKNIHFYRLTGSDNYLKTASEAYALDHYAPVNFHTNLYETDEYTDSICLALMDVARDLDAAADGESPYLTYTRQSSGYPVTIIKDKALVYFIATQPENASRIAETVAQYGTTDAATIQGIIDGITPSLAEGSL